MLTVVLHLFTADGHVLPVDLGSQGRVDFVEGRGKVLQSDPYGNKSEIGISLLDSDERLGPEAVETSLITVMARSLYMRRR